MMKSLWIDEVPSRDYGLAITGAATYDAPERDIETVTIEGRNGDLVIDRGRYKNIMIEYPASVARGFGDFERHIKDWLYKSHGYRRLEDDYSPDVYRMGIFRGPLNFDVKPLGRSAELVLQFECKPQRWLKEGEKSFRLEPGADGSVFIHNPTQHPALPLILVYGQGAGSISWYEDSVLRTLEILELNDDIVLNSETMNAYYGGINKNSCVKAPYFPVIPGGGVTVTVSGGITALEITPRWWTL